MISRIRCRSTASDFAILVGLMFSNAIWLFVAPTTISAFPAALTTDTSLVVTMRDGTTIRVTCPDESILWKTVSMSGDVVESQVSLDQIKSVVFAQESASAQVSAVRQLINALNDDDYHVRNDAESRLVTTGLPFIEIIEQFRGHTEREAKYRLARVLDRLRNDSDDSVIPTALQFDKLETTDGRKLEGDIGDWVLHGQWNDMTISADRTNCSGIASESIEMSQSSSAIAGEPVISSGITSISYFLINQKPKPGMTFVDFETGNGNVALQYGVKEPVGEFFTFAGCRFQCDSFEGDVVISGYKFKKGISRKISLCNLYVDPVSKKSTRYNGIMRIEFCAPGEPGIPAGVNAIGTGTEIVVPKQTLVEAWNSAGHIIGLTYAADDKNSFLGATSNQPIVALTVGANRYLDVEKVNEDYAIDDLCFSKPITVHDLNRVADNKVSVIITRDGERLMVDSIKFRSQDSQVEFTLDINQETVSMPMSGVKWIVGPQDGLPKSRKFDGISVMTRDSSVVHTSATGLAAIDNPELVIPAEEVIGVWNPSSPARYPRPTDFEKGSVVVVRPLHRIASAATIDWGRGTIEFDLEKSSTMRQAVLANPPPDSDVPTPSDETTVTDIADFEVATIAGKSFKIAELANVWTARPTIRAEGTGLLRTNDGQQFVLGGSSGFSMTGFDETTITLARDGQSLTFDLSQIYALEFPNE